MTRTNRRLLIMPAIFILMWVGVVWLELSTVAHVDRLISTALNSVVGQSPSLDLTLVFLTQNSGDLLLTIIAVALIVGLVRHDKHRPLTLGNYAAGLVYFGGLAGLTFLAVEVIDDYVFRQTPGVAIESFRNPATSIGMQWLPNNYSRFPSERAAIFTLLFFLSLFRFGTRALVLAILPVGVGALRITVGQSWPTDVAAGFLMGWLVATGVYLVKGNRLYTSLDRRFETNAISHFGTRVANYLRRKISPLRAPLRRRKKGPIPLPAPVSEALKTHWGIEDARLLAPPHKGKVFPIDHNGRQLGFKLSRKHADESKELTSLLQMAGDMGARDVVRTVPIVPTLDSRLVIPYDDRLAYVMEWVSGRPCDVADPEQRRALYALLARLHRDTADRVTEPPPSIASIVEEQAHAMSEALVVARPEIFRAFQAVLPEGCEFADQGSLVEEAYRAVAMTRVALIHCVEGGEPLRQAYIHGDAHPMNFLHQDDGGLIVLDYDTMRPGFAYEDLSMVLSRVMRLHNWRFSYFEEAISVYTSIRPICRWEIVMLLARITFPKVIEKWSGERKRANPFTRRRHQLALLKDVMQNALSSGERDDFLRGATLRYGLVDLPITLQPHPLGSQQTISSSAKVKKTPGVAVGLGDTD